VRHFIVHMRRASYRSAPPLNCGVRRMRRTKRISYPKDRLVAVLRSLEQVVVSLDRIGSATHDWSEASRHRELGEFVVRSNMFRKLARARGILSEGFSNSVGPDGLSELEREVKGVRYWKPATRKRQNRLR